MTASFWNQSNEQMSRKTYGAVACSIAVCCAMLSMGTMPGVFGDTNPNGLQHQQYQQVWHYVFKGNPNPLFHSGDTANSALSDVVKRRLDPLRHQVEPKQMKRPLEEKKEDPALSSNEKRARFEGPEQAKPVIGLDHERSVRTSSPMR